MKMKHLIRNFLILALLVPFGIPTGQVHGQITYSFSGFVVPFSGSNLTDVGFLETYTALFLIDDSVVDTNPGLNGLYEGAILSSSIEFSGGYVSMVDFTGGNIEIQFVLATNNTQLLLTPPNRPS